MPAEGVALEPREQVVQHLLADPPRAARGQLEPLAVARQVAGVLEPAGQVLERVEVPHRFVAEQLADLVAIDAGEVGRRLDAGESLLEPIHRLEPADLGEGAIEAERLVAAERRRVRRGRRATAWSRFAASWARSTSSRSSRSSASIIDCSSARCSGLIERSSDCIAAIRCGELVDDVIEGLGAGEEVAVLGQELATRPGRRRPSARGSAR